MLAQTPAANAAIQQMLRSAFAASGAGGAAAAIGAHVGGVASSALASAQQQQQQQQRRALSAAAPPADAAADGPPPGPWVARLASRAVLSVSGAEALPFLQGLVTNDVRPLADAPAAAVPAVYAALVTPKGKLLQDLFVARCGGERRLLLDVDAAGAKGVLSWLARYKLRRPVVIEDASADYAVWARCGGGSDGSGSDASSSGGSGSGDSTSSSSSGGGGGAAAAAAAANEGTGWWRDPRLPGGQLGERRIAPAALAGAAAVTGGGGGWREADASAHRLLRYSLGVAEGGIEAPPERFAPLELSLDALGGVSYTKGCYIGQERNSYTHFRGIVRRRVMPVRLVYDRGDGARGGSGGGAAIGAEVVEKGGGGGSGGGRGGSGAVGTLLAAEGALGLAHLRLGPALMAAAGHGAELVLASGSGGGGGGGVAVVPFRPAWWPPDWGHEEGAL